MRICVGGRWPSLAKRSHIIGYCRSQTLTAFSPQAFMSGASATSKVNSTGYRKGTAFGSESIVNSRTTSGCARSPVGRTRRALTARPWPAASALPAANAASGSKATPSADASSAPAVRASAPAGPAGDDRNGLQRNGAVEDERQVVGRGRVAVGGEVARRVGVEGELADAAGGRGQRRLDHRQLHGVRRRGRLGRGLNETVGRGDDQREQAHRCPGSCGSWVREAAG